MKYFFLAAVFLGPLLMYAIIGLGEPVFCKYICPAGTIEGAAPLFAINENLRGAAGWLTLWKGILAGLMILTAAVIFRPFCRFICPLGAIYGFLTNMPLPVYMLIKAGVLPAAVVPLFANPTLVLLVIKNAYPAVIVCAIVPLEPYT